MTTKQVITTIMEIQRIANAEAAKAMEPGMTSAMTLKHLAIADGLRRAAAVFDMAQIEAEKEAL